MTVTLQDFVYGLNDSYSAVKAVTLTFKLTKDISLDAFAFPDFVTKLGWGVYRFDLPPCKAARIDDFRKNFDNNLGAVKFFDSDDKNASTIWFANGDWSTMEEIHTDDDIGYVVTGWDWVHHCQVSLPAGW